MIGNPAEAEQEEDDGGGGDDDDEDDDRLYSHLANNGGKCRGAVIRSAIYLRGNNNKGWPDDPDESFIHSSIRVSPKGWECIDCPFKITGYRNDNLSAIYLPPNHPPTLNLLLHIVSVLTEGYLFLMQFISSGPLCTFRWHPIHYSDPFGSCWLAHSHPGPLMMMSPERLGNKVAFQWLN